MAPRTIPPLLPHQIESPDGVIHGTLSELVVTATPDAAPSLTVTVSTDATGPHTFDLGDGRTWDSLDPTERHTYAQAGT